MYKVSVIVGTEEGANELKRQMAEMNHHLYGRVDIKNTSIEDIKQSVLLRKVMQVSDSKKTISFRVSDDEQVMIGEIKDRLQMMYPEIIHPLLGTKQMNYTNTDAIAFALKYTYENWMKNEGKLE